MAESGTQTKVVCFGRALQEYLLVEDLVGLYAVLDRGSGLAGLRPVTPPALSPTAARPPPGGGEGRGGCV